MKGRSAEIIETLSRRKIDLCCAQETRWRGSSNTCVRLLSGKNTRYKFYWSGNSSGSGGVGILLAEKWIDKVIDVTRYNDRAILLKIVMGESILSFISAYAPQQGLDESVKDTFYDLTQDIVMKIPEKELVFPCGDWNGHIGQNAIGFEGIHGGCSYGKRNAEGLRLLDFATANDFVIGNSFFTKRESHLVTYESGGNKSVVDYILLRKPHLKLVKDIKVIPSEEAVPQHKLLVCEIVVPMPKTRKRKFVPRLRTWKLRDPGTSEIFEAKFKEKSSSDTLDGVESKWAHLKNTLLDTAKEVCNFTKKSQTETRVMVVK